MSIMFITDYERKLIDKMQMGGVSFEEAAICTLFYFHEFSRPVAEMPMILSRYFAELTEDKVNNTFETLIDNKLIEVGQLGNLQIYRLSERFEERFQEYTKIDYIAEELIEQKKIYQESQYLHKSKVNFTPRGAVSAEGNYQTLLTRLYSANSSIKTAILCSKVYEDTAIVFEKMAKTGVRIQILIASDKLVKKVRGKTVNGTYDDWKERLKESRNIEIREFDDISATELCSSFLIDGSVLRLVVFDSATMPSLEGYLIEVVQEQNTNINLVNWYKTKFDIEWENAKFSRRSLLFKILFSRIALSLIGGVIVTIIILAFNPEGLIFELLFMLLGVCITYFCQNSYFAISSRWKRLAVAFKNTK